MIENTIGKIGDAMPEHEAMPLRRGVIAVVLRPETNERGNYTGRHLYYCLETKRYQHDDRTIEPGIGLLSETYENGETDPKNVIARSYVEEMLGLKLDDGEDEEEFRARVEDVKHIIVEQCAVLGTFQYKFNYKDPSRYLTEPDTCADVVVLLDDDRNLPLGPIHSEEIEAAYALSSAAIHDPSVRMRSGYDVRHLLEDQALVDILNEGEIKIAQHDRRK